MSIEIVIAGLILLALAMHMGWLLVPVQSTKAQWFIEERAKRERRQTSLHEAGHAVVEWWSTVVDKVDNVRLTPVGGNTNVEYSGPLDSDEAQWCMLVANLAGIAAECSTGYADRLTDMSNDLREAFMSSERLALRGSLHPPWPTDHLETHTMPFEEMFASPFVERQAEILQLAYRSARTILAVHDRQFQQVASALEERGELPSDQLQAILGDRTAIRVIGPHCPTFLPLWGNHIIMQSATMATMQQEGGVQ